MLTQYVVDTFTDRLFSGNPAAVCLLESWPSDDLLLLLARENALSHTAFLLPTAEGRWQMRWFTPKTEIDLCGHAALAAGFVVLTLLHPELSTAVFETKSGALTVRKDGDWLELDFPAYQLKQLEVTDAICEALGAVPREVWRARDLLCIFDDPDTVRTLKPDMDKLLKVKGALMQVTAPGDGEFDCVSRTFAPKMGLPEDPVCGSGHCHIVPYWSARLGKDELKACQASPRGGVLRCRMAGDRVLLAGQARLYSVSQIMMEEFK